MTHVKVGDIVRIEVDPTEWEVASIEPGRIRLSRSYTNDKGWPVMVSAETHPGVVWFVREGTSPKFTAAPGSLTIRRLSADEFAEYVKDVDVRLGFDEETP